MAASPIAGILAAQLLCSSIPTVQREALLASMRARLPDAQPLDENEKSTLLAFVHPKHVVSYKGGSAPAQTFVAVADQPPQPDAFRESIQQSWAFPEAASVVSRCKACVVVSELMARGLDHRARLALFQDALLAVLSIVKCDGVHLPASQQLLPPARIIEALSHDPPARHAAGAINIRMFNVSDGADDMVMDSMGLAVLGLCDVQCHFRQLDPNAVARVLYNTAAYLLERGDVIQDGHTVEGVTPGSRWRCRHEGALVPPAREVLDLHPGDRSPRAGEAEGNSIRG